MIQLLDTAQQINEILALIPDDVRIGWMPIIRMVAWILGFTIYEDGIIDVGN